MNLFSETKNTNTLKVVLVALYTGVKVNIKLGQPTDSAPNKTLPVFEIDKTQSLFDTFAICRYLANKQKKVPLIPDEIEGFLVDQILEEEVETALLDKLEASIQGTFLVGTKLTLADVHVWSELNAQPAKLEKYSKLTKWFHHLKDNEKNFKIALAQVGF